jgi:hypothetical protein
MFIWLEYLMETVPCDGRESNSLFGFTSRNNSSEISAGWMSMSEADSGERNLQKNQNGRITKSRKNVEAMPTTTNCAICPVKEERSVETATFTPVRLRMAHFPLTVAPSSE